MAERPRKQTDPSAYHVYIQSTVCAWCTTCTACCCHGNNLFPNMYTCVLLVQYCLLLPLLKCMYTHAYYMAGNIYWQEYLADWSFFEDWQILIWWIGEALTRSGRGWAPHAQLHTGVRACMNNWHIEIWRTSCSSAKPPN